MAHIRAPLGDMDITRNGIIIQRLQGTVLVLLWLPSPRLIPNPTRLIRVTRTPPRPVLPTMVIPNHATVAVSMEPHLEEALIAMPHLRRTLMTIVTTTTHLIIPPSLHIRPMLHTMVTLRVVTMILTLLARNTVTIVDTMTDTTR